MELLQNCDQLCHLQEDRNALCRENEQLASKNYDISIANDGSYNIMLVLCGQQFFHACGNIFVLSDSVDNLAQKPLIEDRKRVILEKVEMCLKYLPT